MAGPSANHQLFQDNVAQAFGIASEMSRCGADIAETVARTKGVIAESRGLIALIDQLLARPNP